MSSDDNEKTRDGQGHGEELRPRLPIRRFDVFAEYNRQKAIEDGIPLDEAMGYGLWVAKVVASRSFGRSALSKPPSELQKLREGESGEGEGEGEAQSDKPKWHSLDGKPQTDEFFEKEIVRRMGAGFYHNVFVPAIEQAIAQDRTYQSIRDTIRKEWKPG